MRTTTKNEKGYRVISEKAQDTEVIKIVREDDDYDFILVDKEDAKKVTQKRLDISFTFVDKKEATTRDEKIYFYHYLGGQVKEPLSHFILNDRTVKVFYRNGNRKDFTKENLDYAGKNNPIRNKRNTKEKDELTGIEINGPKYGATKQSKEDKKQDTSTFIDYIYNEAGDKVGASYFVKTYW